MNLEETKARNDWAGEDQQQAISLKIRSVLKGLTSSNMAFAWNSFLFN
jgi:hypothetical protein